MVIAFTVSQYALGFMHQNGSPITSLYEIQS